MSKLIDSSAELRQERLRAAIEDPVYCVEPEGVDVEVSQPEKRVLNEEVYDLVAMRPVKVDGLPPRRAIAICEVRPEVGEVVPLRAEVVVNNVEHNGEATLVAGIHEALQAERAAVCVLYGKRKNTVVAPIPCARKLGHGH